jgi:hypothetical protein
MSSIYVCGAEMIQIILKSTLDITLKSRRSVTQSERHNQILELIVSRVECDQSFVFFFYLYSVESVNNIELDEDLRFREFD